MEIKERKIRKSGNSIVLTLSKEVLEKIGVKENDFVYVDEEKLIEAISKKEPKSSYDLKIDQLINDSFHDYEQMYKELANH
ncbi:MULTISPECIES: addiction module antitoxin [Enterococcus]|uniref:addiction module antitoxin n=1 Tax=Enterococcus TaxID=1350 RepID=UPI0007C1A7E1|nr:addiction module antitoxin [Enterococcus hirae]AND72702.1 addiction module antitoxin [Enterococcus hirae]EMF0108574.1 addiction module antitoxin [Enterococcus hirae]